jgi:RND family efflux transporter MFP subunit
MLYLKTLTPMCFFFVIVILSGAALAQIENHTGSITKSFTEPIEQSIAASAETGIVTFAAVKEGDRVNVGDVLASINYKVLEQSLKIAKARAESTARLDAATSQLEMIKSQLKALEDLVSGGHTNKFEVEQKKAAHENAYAEYRAAQDELKLNQLEVHRIEAQIEDRIIKSPIDGFVTEIHKQPGENVSNNEPQYATIVRVDELKVRFYQDVETLGGLRKDDIVTILIGRSRSRKEATITYVSPIIDPDSGLGRVDVTIDNRDFGIKSGVICFWNEASDASQAARQPDDMPLLHR